MRLKLYRKKWAIVWSEGGDTIRRSTRTADRAAAEAILKDFQHKLELQALPDGTPYVGAVIERYFKAHPSRIYRRALVNWWKSHLPEHVTQTTVGDYLRHRAGRSSSTLRSEVGILLTALKWAKLPVPTLDELPPEAPPRERWITRAQADKLLATAVSPHMKAFTALTIYTGARAGAILDLTWDRVTEKFIDFNNPNKRRTRKRRAVVPMHDELWTILVETRATVEGDHVIQHGGKPVKSVKKAFSRQAKLAGLPGVGPLTLRHSVATWMAMDGISFRKIADVLGNSEKMIEKVYAKFAPGYLADAIAALGRGQVVQLNRSLADEPGTASETESSSARKVK